MSMILLTGRAGTALGLPGGAPPALDTVLIGHWKLDDTSGGANDETANANDGVYENVVLGEDSMVVGDAGSSVRFSGDSHVAVPHIAAYAVAGYSIVVYAQISSGPTAGANAMLVQKDRPSMSGGFQVGINNVAGTLRPQVFTKNAAGSATTVAVTGADLSLNTGYMLVMTCGPVGGTRVWLDKVEVGSTSNSTGLAANNEQIGIGRYRPGISNSAGFDGWIDEVRLYVGELTQSEINALPDAQDIAVEEPGEPGELPESPLDTHSPIIQMTGTIEAAFNPAARSDGPCYDYGLTGRSPAPARVWHNNCGWDGTTQRPPTSEGSDWGHQVVPAIPYPIRQTGHPGSAIVGGLHTGRNPYIRARTADIDFYPYCNSGVIGWLDGTNHTIFGVHIRRGWDGIKVGGSKNDVGRFVVTIEHSWVREICDDGVEGDSCQSWTMRHCLFEGNFIAMSMDQGGTKIEHFPSSGPQDIVTLEDCLFENGHQIQSTLVSGDAGQAFFKTDNGCPGLILRRCVFAFAGNTIASSFNRHRRYFGPNNNGRLVECTGPHWVLCTGNSGFPAHWWTSCDTDQAWFTSRGFNFLDGAAARNKWAELRNQWIADHWYIPRFSDEPDPPPIYNRGPWI